MKTILVYVLPFDNWASFRIGEVGHYVKRFADSFKTLRLEH